MGVDLFKGSLGWRFGGRDLATRTGAAAAFQAATFSPSIEESA